MSVVFLDASGPAPPQVCWERYAVPANWPSWAPQIRAVELDAPMWPGAPAWSEEAAGARRRPTRGGVAAATAVAGPVRIAPGLRGRLRTLLPPAARFVVTAVDETERTWSWRVGLGPLCLDLDHGVDACLDGGTSAWLRITAPAPVVRGYVPVARAALRHLVH
ncbi:hypothetical protein UG55_100339 [Frankia sp. EI5c]|uniref:polyketide cyclase / dehydrase and lipid transport n=1 Tax=Frankia sp. EI5c TaxID=683316 RepID=UPI0007C409BB|nr:polyketide cyclase / dehydrase and lipid transport [Frankia sp. EI5c]OAA29228.1 hypothetical protein UG55_100339 [Frankia sp. EI5c]